jgi:uncharacterized membrane protein
MKTALGKQIGKERLIRLKEEEYNERLAEFLLNERTLNKIFDAGDRYIRKADPVLMKPGTRYGRAHFYAPYKQVGNLKINTMVFNTIAIWIMTIGLFATLYFNLLKHLIIFLEGLKIPILRKFGRELLRT